MVLLLGAAAGVDMTPEQLEVAKRYSGEWTATLGYPAPNMTFLEGGQHPGKLTPGGAAASAVTATTAAAASAAAAGYMVE